MSTTTTPVLLPPAKIASYKATNGVSTTTQKDACQISASHSTSSQSSYSSGTSSVTYGHGHSASSYASVEYEKSGECKYETKGCGQATAEVEFAKLMSEIPWMRFQITATPDVAWLEEERFKAVFHRLTQKTVRATTARVISQVRVAMSEVLDRLEVQEEHINMTTVIEDIQKAFVAGACGAVTTGQILTAGHLPCGCHHNHGGSKCGGATLSTGPCNGKPAPKEPCNPSPAPAIIPCTNPPSKAPPPDLSAAQWIWTQEGSNNKIPPIGARSFRKSVTLDEVVDSVTIDITSDNYDTLYINGKVVGSGEDWKTARRYTVRVEPTKQIVVSVWAMQGDSGGPAAIVLAGVAWNSQKINPVPYKFCSDSSWKTQSKGASEKIFLEALDSKYDDGCWDKVFIYGQLESGAWKGQVTKPSKESKGKDRLTNIKGCADAPKAVPANVL